MPAEMFRGPSRQRLRFDWLWFGFCKVRAGKDLGRIGSSGTAAWGFGGVG